MMIYAILSKIQMITEFAFFGSELLSNSHLNIIENIFDFFFFLFTKVFLLSSAHDEIFIS